MTNKSKYFKNTERDKTKIYEPYIPQYQILGKEPIKVGKSSAPKKFSTLLVKDSAIANNIANPRLKANFPFLGKNVPYADTGLKEIQVNSSLPNVGNNIENSWTGTEYVENEDQGLDMFKPMIDNNFYVDVENASQKTNNKEYLLDISSAEVDEFILMLNGEIISIGSHEDIESEVRAFVVEEHPLCKNNTISLDDIIILKRIKIKMGVFLENS